MKNIIIQKYFIVVVSIILLIILTGCSEKVSQLEVEATIGFDSSIKVASDNPFTIKIKNNGEDITGEVQLEINKTGLESTVFAKEFQLSSGAEKEIQMVVPIYTIQKKINIKVVSEGKILYEDVIKAEKYLSPSQPIIAVISDQPDKYRFFNSINFNYFNLSENIDYYYQSTVEVVEEETNEPVVYYFNDFSQIDLFDSYDYFNYIYIGDNSNLSVTNEIESKLLDWVSLGNTLMLETGEDYKRLYSFLPDSITNFTVESFEKVDLGIIFDNVGLSGPITLAKGDSIDQRQVIVHEEMGYPLVQFTKQEAGSIINILMEFNSGEYKNWPNKANMFSKILTMGSATGANIFGNDINEVYDYDFSDMLNYIPTEKNPPYIIMGIVLLVYIIIVGPVLYIVLKKRDKRDFMWIYIPILSLACIVVLYLFGFSTRYKKPIVNTISSIEYSDGQDYIHIQSNIGVFNNKSGNMRIEWNPKEKIKLSYGNSYNYNYNENANQRHTITGKLSQGNRVLYEVYDTPLWEKSDFTATKVLPIDITKEGEFVEFEIIEDIVHLKIYNKTPFDLETAYVQWGSSYIYLGDIKGNEVSEIEFSLDEMYLDFYSFIENIRTTYNLYEGNSEMRSNIELYERINNYNYAPTVSQGSIESVKIMGINHDEIGYEIKVNENETENFNRNIILLNAKIVFEKGTKLSIPSSLLVPYCEVGTEEDMLYERVANNYMDGNKYYSIYEEDIMEFTYTIPSYLDIESLNLTLNPLYLEQEFYEKNGFGSQIKPLSGVTYEMYNFVSEKYELVDIIGEEFEVDLVDYLGVDDELKIRLKVSEQSDEIRFSSKIVEMPLINIEGSAK